jgi:hypothetical protein
MPIDQLEPGRELSTESLRLVHGGSYRDLLLANMERRRILDSVPQHGPPGWAGLKAVMEGVISLPDPKRPAGVATKGMHLLERLRLRGADTGNVVPLFPDL